MFGDPDEAGTTDAVVEGSGNAAAEATDAPAGGDEGAKGKTVTIPFDEYMSLKTQREADNRARAERATRDTATDTRAPEAKDLRDKIAARENRLSRLRLAAEGGNEDAQVLVDTLEEVQASEKRQVYRLEMRDIPESKREAVAAEMRRIGSASPFATYKWMRGEEADELEQKVKTLEEQVEKQRTPKPKVEPTKMPTQVSRSAGNGSGPKEVSPQEWIEAMKDPKTRREFKSAKAANKLKIVSR